MNRLSSDNMMWTSAILLAVTGLTFTMLVGFSVVSFDFALGFLFGEFCLYFVLMGQATFKERYQAGGKNE